jgi:hypothetical protein
MKIDKSKFYKPKTKERKLEDIKHFFLFWKGRSKGMVYTRNLRWDDLRFIFFPNGFEEKYGYLGTSIYEASHYFNAIYPLVLALDYEAKPKWCPRWFLRFTHVFGNDKSIIRVRNRFWHNLHSRITGGIGFIDWKTKWSDYDLRISIAASKHLQDLADDIESGVYKRGYRESLVQKLKELDPQADPHWTTEGLIKQIDALNLNHEVTEDGKIKFKHEKEI